MGLLAMLNGTRSETGQIPGTLTEMYKGVKVWSLGHFGLGYLQSK